MVHVTSDDHPPYDRLLRALGAWLDERAPAAFTVVETPGGFSVVYSDARANDRQAMSFTFRGLLEFDAALARRRRPDAGPEVARSEAHRHWSLSPTGRQDCLRAIGFELDDAEGRSIVLDELEDGLHLSYSYVDARQGYLWHKQRVALRWPEIAQVLSVARGRRHLISRTKVLGGLRRQMRQDSATGD